MGQDGVILWEAHRGGGGGREMPESCPLSFEYGWMLGGRPEADVNRTADGEMISLHDNTLDHTAWHLPDELKGVPVGQLTLAQIRSCDIGWPEYPNQRVPTIRELLECLRSHPERNMIIDYKRVDLGELASLIREYDAGAQITFASCDTGKCREIKALLPEIRIKVWIGGTREQILEKFESLSAGNFLGFEEVQLHLNDLDPKNSDWRYQLEPDDIRSALERTRCRNVLLQVLPWQFEREDLLRILELGVRSFAVDYPNRFCRICAEYFASKW